MIRQLLDIMHHAEQLPLTIHLGFPAQRKAVQPLVAAQVAKHRLHCCKSSRDHLPARIRIDFLFHPIDMIFTGIAIELLAADDFVQAFNYVGELFGGNTANFLADSPR